MKDLFIAIEHSAFSLWMREDPYAYFIALILHAFGMALLVGAGIVICLRVLGVGNGANLGAFRGFLPLMWLGAVLAILSGISLLWSYPAKALTNPVFALKFACLIGATLLMRRLCLETPTAGARRRAGVALLLWLGAVVAGKMLLHTYKVLTVG